MNTIKYYPHIDGLRAVAVSVVLLFHVGFERFSGGYIGVDVFFVISGFLITKLIKDEIEKTDSFSFSSFYVRRARRLFPALFLTLVLSFIVSVYILSPPQFERFCGVLISALMSVSNIIFWTESGYFDVDANFKPLLHTWSLSVEEQFYFFWPFVCFLLVKKLSKRGVLFSIFCIGAASFSLNILFEDGFWYFHKISDSVGRLFSDGQSTIFYLTPFRIFEFCIGAAVVWVKNVRFKNEIFENILSVLGLIFIFIPVFTYTDDIVFPSYSAIVPCLGTAILIYSEKSSCTKLLLENRLMVGIGLVSYSLYLVHWPLIVFWKFFFGSGLATSDQILLIIISIVLAYLSYRYVELPFRRSIPLRKSDSKRSVALACVSLSFFLAIPATHAWANKGWVWRIDDQLSGLFPVKLSEERQRLIRAPDCHMNREGEAFDSFIKRFHLCNNSIENHSTEIIVLGDSHAADLFATLRKFSNNESSLKLVQITGAGCALSQLTTHPDDRCAHLLKFGMNYIENNKDKISVVLYAERGVQGLKVLPESANDFINQLKQSFPALGVVPFLYVTRPQFGDPQNNIMKSLDVDGFLEIHKKTIRLDLNALSATLAESFKEIDGAEVLELKDHLCEVHKCRIVDDEKNPLYIDYGHFSKYGMSEISGFLAGRLNSYQTQPKSRDLNN